MFDLPINMIYALKFDMPVGRAALIALLGLVIVFAVLAVLVGLLTLFKLIFNLKIFKKDSPAPSSPATESAPIVSTDDNEDEIIAAIMAAIACMNETDSGTEKAPFVIKSIRKLK